MGIFFGLYAISDYAYLSRRTLITYSPLKANNRDCDEEFHGYDHQLCYSDVSSCSSSLILRTVRLLCGLLLLYWQLLWLIQGFRACRACQDFGAYSLGLRACFVSRAWLLAPVINTIALR